MTLSALIANAQGQAIPALRIRFGPADSLSRAPRKYRHPTQVCLLSFTQKKRAIHILHIEKYNLELVKKHLKNIFY